MHSSASAASPVEEDAGRLREYQIPELEVGLSARRNEEVVLTEFGWEDRQEIALHLVVSVEAHAARLVVLLDLGLEFCDTRGHLFKIFHRARVEHPDFSAKFFEA